MKKYDIKTTDEATLRKWYYLMTLGRALDEKTPSYLLQSLGWSFHAPYAGHDGIQLAIGQVFTKGEDFLFPYYRDMLTALSAGMSVEELILNGISKATDPGSGGRHMSNHFAKPEWHIENVSSATGTHDLHAAGVARAMVYYGHRGVAITSHGESASSEGFVYEAVNGASLERLPVIFVWQDNGYGISVPKDEQTANRKVADNFSGFKNLKIIHCNGKDVFDSMNAMTEAREFAIANRTPVIVHANCVRIGSHSNSDKHTLYRDENELTYVKDADPLMKFRRMLLRYKRLSEEDLQKIEAEAKKELSAANRKALAAPDPDPKSIFDFVLPEPYEPKKYPDGTHKEVEGEKAFMVTAINETLKSEFRRNPDTFIWGQDVANKEKEAYLMSPRRCNRSLAMPVYSVHRLPKILSRRYGQWYVSLRPEGHIVIGAGVCRLFLAGRRAVRRVYTRVLAKQRKICSQYHLRLASGRLYRWRTVSLPKHRRSSYHPSRSADCVSFFCR